MTGEPSKETTMISKNKLLIISFCLSFIIFNSTLKASEVVLATITTDVDSESWQLKVETDDHERALLAFHIDNFTPGKEASRDTLSMEEFIRLGLNLPHKSPRSFARISGIHFDRDLGGAVIIDTLYNAISGKRKSYELHLALDHKEGWKLFYRGKAITQIRALAHKIPVIGVVGAKELLMN